MDQTGSQQKSRRLSELNSLQIVFYFWLYCPLGGTEISPQVCRRPYLRGHAGSDAGFHHYNQLLNRVNKQQTTNNLTFLWVYDVRNVSLRMKSVACCTHEPLGVFKNVCWGIFLHLVKLVFFSVPLKLNLFSEASPCVEKLPPFYPSGVILVPLQPSRAHACFPKVWDCGHVD